MRHRKGSPGKVIQDLEEKRGQLGNKKQNLEVGLYLMGTQVLFAAGPRTKEIQDCKKSPGEMGWLPCGEGWCGVGY